MSKLVDKDDLLIKLLQSGDPQAMTEIFREYGSMVTRIVYRMLHDHEAAKDITQDLFISIWEKRNDLNIKNSLKAYLIRAAINEALYYIRSQRRISTLRVNELENPDACLQDKVNNPAMALTAQELEEHIQNIIDKLPPKCKLVYRLSRDEEMTYKQIAQELNVSVKVVEKHISKALKTLREALKGRFLFFLA